MKKPVLENQDTLDYYMFDWDDNILVMPTVIHLEHLVTGVWIPTDITTAEFTNIRIELFKYYEEGESNWRFINDDRDEAFAEFRDEGIRGDGAFIEDTKNAINLKSYGPIWDEFIDCLINGNRFLIVTARGHEPESIKNSVKWIIYNVLTIEQRTIMVKNLKEWYKLFNTLDIDWVDDDYIEYYLTLCSFIGIFSDWFAENFDVGGEMARPEKYKPMAIKYFIQKISKFGDILNKKVKVGFSDDDLLTAQSIQKYFRDELSLDFPLDYHTYHTKEDGTKTKID